MASLLKRLKAQLNPFDGGADWNNPDGKPQPPVGQQIAKGIANLPNIRLRGLEQLTGRQKSFGGSKLPVDNPITIGDVARHTPVLSDAIEFANRKESERGVGDFTKSILGSGYKNSPVPATVRTGGRGIAELQDDKQVTIPTVGRVLAPSRQIKEQGGLATAIDVGFDAVEALPLAGAVARPAAAAARKVNVPTPHMPQITLPGRGAPVANNAVPVTEIPRTAPVQTPVVTQTAPPGPMVPRMLPDATESTLIPNVGRERSIPLRAPRNGDFAPADPRKVNNERGDFGREAQVLNTNNLDLNNSQRAELMEMSQPDVITKLSNDEVLDLAKRSGIDTKSYTPAQTREKMAEQLNMRRQVVELSNELEAMRAAGAPPELEAAQYMKVMAASKTSREQGTDLGRQLQARRIMANELDTPMQKIFKLLDEAGVNPEVAATRAVGVNWADGDSVAAFYRSLVPAKFGEWVDAVRYNSMLSSPLTHSVNIFGNAVNAGIVAPTEKAIAGAIDFLRAGVTRTERQAFAGEGAAYTKGYLSSLKKATTNMIETLSGAKAVDNLDVRDIALAQDGIKGAAYSALSVPTKLLGAMDSFFRTLAVGGEKAALGFRESKGVAVRGLDELAETNAAYRIFQQDLKDPNQGAILSAMDDFTGAIMTLREKPGLGGRVAKFVFPFVKTPSNIVKQGVEYSPLGWSTLIGAQNKTEQAAKALMGTAVFSTAYMMLESGRVTWAEPTDPKKKAAFREAGMQPYAIKIGNNWVAFNKLPPTVAFPFALTAGLKDAEANGLLGEDQLANVLEGIASTTNFYADQSYLKTMGDTIAGVKGDAERMAQVPSNFATQMIPGRAFSGWIARMNDDTERTITKDASFWQKQGELLAMNYPGLREDLPARMGVDGVTPIPANNPGLNSISPVRITSERGSSAEAYKAMQETAIDNRQARADKAAGIESGAKLGGSEILNKAQTRIDDAKEKMPEGISDGSKNLLLRYAKLNEKGKSKFNAYPKNGYELRKAQYEQKKLSGELTETEDYKEKQAIGKLSITSNYSKEVNDLYGMSKAARLALLEEKPELLKLMPEVAKLSAELSGRKFSATDKIATAAKGGRGRAKGKGRKPGKLKIPSYSSVAANTNAMSSLVKGSTIKVSKAKSPKPPKVKTAKVKLPKTRNQIA